MAEPTSDALRQDDWDPAVAEALDAAYRQDIGVEAAARHLWMIHRAAGTMQHTSRRSFRRAAVAVLAGIMLITSSGGALAASSSALPGDMLYSVKRGAERARLLLTVSTDGDAKLHLVMAKKRMSEAEQALERSRHAVVPGLVSEAIDALEIAERVGGPSMAVETQQVRRTATERVVVLVAALEDPDRQELEASASRLGEDSATAEEPPQAEPGDTVSPEPAPRPTTTPSDGTATPTSDPESPSPSPSPDATPTESPSPTSPPTPSEAPTPTATPTPTTSPSAEPTPSDPDRSKDYDSEGEPVPSEGDRPKNYESEDEPEPAPTPTGVTSEDEDDEDDEDESDEDASPSETTSS